jgi:hypothetical protein
MPKRKYSNIRIYDMICAEISANLYKKLAWLLEDWGVCHLQIPRRKGETVYIINK